MSILLSKTDYILFRECPKNVWLKIHRPEIYFESELSEFDKALMRTGNEVEAVARGLFPTGVLIEGRDFTAQEATQAYISNKQAILFQPIFVKDGFLAALDILKFNPENGTYSIYEVKATNEVDDKDHYHDLAFQVNLLRKFGYIVETAHLIHLNAEYVRSGELDIAGLFKIEDVTVAVNGLCDVVMEEMQKALVYVSGDVEPSGPCCCIYKGRSKHCSTFRHSNPKVPEYGVHDISRIGISKAKLEEMIDMNIFDLSSVPEHIKLSDIQRNQITAHVLDEVLIRRDKIAEELSSLTFPLHFLDYETFPCAIPRFDKFTPYQQVPFQYSLYILDSKNSEPRHFEFLYTGSDDPSSDLAKSLRQHIGDVGSIIVWSKSFECKINKEMGQRMPHFSEFMESINTRVYDLMDIFGKHQYYVHKGFRGKSSIKSILPVLVPGLSYKVLGIQEGGTASQRWNDLTTGNISVEEKERIAQDLKEYCKLDTLAMYSIWDVLSGVLAS